MTTEEDRNAYGASNFRLDIDIDNAAFEEPGELARILVDLADFLDALPERGMSGKVRDVNGNSVGTWRAT